LKKKHSAKASSTKKIQDEGGGGGRVQVFVPRLQQGASKIRMRKVLSTQGEKMAKGEKAQRTHSGLRKTNCPPGT